MAVTRTHLPSLAGEWIKVNPRLLRRLTMEVTSVGLVRRGIEIYTIILVVGHVDKGDAVLELLNERGYISQFLALVAFVHIDLIVTPNIV